MTTGRGFDGQEVFDFDDRLYREFLAFHEANPDVYAALVQRCRAGLAVGVRRWGIGSLWEGLRWHWRVEVNRTDVEFKLNNNHRAFYARLIMAQEPDLAGFFETRRSAADRMAMP